MNEKNFCAFFFDKNLSDPFYNLWCKNPLYFPKDLHEHPIIAQGLFYKKGKTLKLTKARYYYMTNDYLYYKYKENSIKIKGVLQFFNIFYKDNNENPTKNGSKRIYSFKLRRNLDKTKLFTLDATNFETFYKRLVFKCILGSFQKDYKLIKMIGKGSFAKVYLAQNINTHNFYAVKAFYKEQVIAQTNGREALLNEIEILRKLAGHKNLLSLNEVYESKNSIYFVMDLLEGGELLSDLTAQNPYKESRIAVILKNILEALVIVHSKGIIHRDIKPENILFRSEGNLQDLVIADFGLATPKHSDIKKVVFKRCGTPGYVAPEILIYKENMEFYDMKSDVFSVGVLFYIMITNGVRPFKGADVNETLSLNKKGIVNYSKGDISKLTPQGLDLLKKLLNPLSSLRLSSSEALNHSFFTLSPQKHDENFEVKLQLKQEELEEEIKNQNDSLSSENIGIINDSINKLFQNPSNNFEYQNNCLNGRLETFIDSSKCSSKENIMLGSRQNNFSCFSGVGVSQSPEKIYSNFNGLSLKSSEIIKKENEDGRKRSSLSPKHSKKPSTTNEFYKMALMNHKKNSEFNN